MNAPRLRRVALLLATGLAVGSTAAPAGEQAARQAAAQPASRLAQLAFMAGSWVGGEQGVITEEHWTAPGGGLMLGIHRDVFPNGRSFFEVLRIEESDGAVVYLASPKGRCPPTAFPLKSADGRRAVFENLEHDWPTRIAYELLPDGRLEARVEGPHKDGAVKAMSWTWSPGSLD